MHCTAAQSFAAIAGIMTELMIPPMILKMGLTHTSHLKSSMQMAVQSVLIGPKTRAHLCPPPGTAQLCC